MRRHSRSCGRRRRRRCVSQADGMKHLESVCSLVEAAPDQLLVREGVNGDAFYVLLLGGVRVTARGKRLADLGPGSYFGEIALLKKVVCTASVSALQHSLLLALHKPEFEALLEVNPLFRQNLNVHAHRRTANRLHSMKVLLCRRVHTLEPF